VQSFAIVEHLDVLEDRLPGLLVRRVLLLMDQFKRYPDLRPNACQDVQKKPLGPMSLPKPHGYPKWDWPAGSAVQVAEPVLAGSCP
jgi:hypothetical protein